MHKSEVTCFWDFVRHLLIISGTIAVLYVSWTRVHWLLAIILALPVYVVMLNIVGLLTLPLYFLTPERKVASKAWKAIDEGDFNTASEILDEYEKK